MKGDDIRLGQTGLLKTVHERWKSSRTAGLPGLGTR